MEKVNIFWTGGFDSTFRICQLSLLSIEIQPYYLSINRKSEIYELKAITDIANYIISNELNRCRLLQLIIVKRDEIMQNKQITDSYNAFKEEIKLGGQYDWLARFAKQSDMKLELGFEYGPTGRPDMLISKYGVLKEVSLPISGGGSIDYCELDIDRSSQNLVDVFGNFRFGLPLYKMTKAQTLEAFSALGYEEVIPMTWFCHNPRKGNPCGLCNPCVQVMDANLGFRIPLRSKIYYYIFRINPFGRLIYKILKTPDKTQILVKKIRVLFKGNG